MVCRRFYNIGELSTILGKTVASIHGHLARKQFDAVPPPIKLGRRLAWPVDGVDAWIAEKAQRADDEVKNQRSQFPVRRRGRPTKKEQWERGEK